MHSIANLTDDFTDSRYFVFLFSLLSLLSTQIRRVALTTMLAARMVASRGHLGPSAPALWVINLAMTPKPARI